MCILLGGAWGKGAVELGCCGYMVLQYFDGIYYELGSCKEKILSAREKKSLERDNNQQGRGERKKKNNAQRKILDTIHSRNRCDVLALCTESLCALFPDIGCSTSCEEGDYDDDGDADDKKLSSGHSAMT